MGWGCPYDPANDVKSQNLQNPLQKDMLSLFRRSWAVIRFKVDNPGVWLFHCHMEQHIPTGQIMAFNLLPSKQPPIPKVVPTEGSCPFGLEGARRPVVQSAQIFTSEFRQCRTRQFRDGNSLCFSTSVDPYEADLQWQVLYFCKVP